MICHTALQSVRWETKIPMATRNLKKVHSVRSFVAISVCYAVTQHTRLTYKQHEN
jgi:hypothetical protein